MRIFPKLGKGYTQTSSLLKQIVHQRVSSLLASFGSMTECEYKKKHKQFFPPFEIESCGKRNFWWHLVSSQWWLHILISISVTSIRFSHKTSALMSISFSFAGTVLSQASNAILAFWLQKKSNQLFLLLLKLKACHWVSRLVGNDYLLLVDIYSTYWDSFGMKGFV